MQASLARSPLLGARGAETTRPSRQLQGEEEEVGLARGGSERGSPRASPAHSARSAPAGTGGLGSRRRRVGAHTLVQPQRAEEPGLCPELGGNVRTGPRLRLAHCGDLAFSGRERAPQLEKRRGPRTFLLSEGRPAGRPVPRLLSGTPRRRGPRRAMEPGLQES